MAGKDSKNLRISESVTASWINIGRVIRDTMQTTGASFIHLRCGTTRSIIEFIFSEVDKLVKRSSLKMLILVISDQTNATMLREDIECRSACWTEKRLRIYTPIDLMVNLSKTTNSVVLLDTDHGRMPPNVVVAAVSVAQHWLKPSSAIHGTMITLSPEPNSLWDAAGIERLFGAKAKLQELELEGSFTFPTISHHITAEMGDVARIPGCIATKIMELVGVELASQTEQEDIVVVAVLPNSLGYAVHAELISRTAATAPDLFSTIITRLSRKQEQKRLLEARSKSSVEAVRSRGVVFVDRSLHYLPAIEKAKLIHITTPYYQGMAWGEKIGVYVQMRKAWSYPGITAISTICEPATKTAECVLVHDGAESQLLSSPTGNMAMDCYIEETLLCLSHYLDAKYLKVMAVLQVSSNVQRIKEALRRLGQGKLIHAKMDALGLLSGVPEFILDGQARIAPGSGIGKSQARLLMRRQADSVAEASLLAIAFDSSRQVQQNLFAMAAFVRVGEVNLRLLGPQKGRLGPSLWDCGAFNTSAGSHLAHKGRPWFALSVFAGQLDDRDIKEEIPSLGLQVFKPGFTEVKRVYEEFRYYALKYDEEKPQNGYLNRDKPTTEDLLKIQQALVRAWIYNIVRLLAGRIDAGTLLEEVCSGVKFRQTPYSWGGDFCGHLDCQFGLHFGLQARNGTLAADSFVTLSNAAVDAVLAERFPGKSTDEALKMLATGYPSSCSPRKAK